MLRTYNCALRCTSSASHWAAGKSKWGQLRPAHAILMAQIRSPPSLSLSHTHTYTHYFVYVCTYGYQIITKGTRQGRKLKHTGSICSRRNQGTHAPSGDTHVAVGPPHTWQTLLVTFARNGRIPSFFFLFLGDVSDIPNVQDSQDCYRRICGEYRTYFNATARGPVHNVLLLSMLGCKLCPVQAQVRGALETRPLWNVRMG